MNMKRIIFLIIALLPFIACAQNNIKKTASIAYTNGAPTFTPNISYSTELAVDTVTSNLYWWSRNASAWTKYPRGVDVIAGSVVPSYTPRDNQALFAINADNELYYYTGATWIQIGGSGGGGIYGGSGTTGAAVTTVTIDSILAFSNTSGNPARFSVLIGDTGGIYAEAKIDTARLTYFDVGGTNGYYLGPDGLKLRTASPDRAIIEGLDARYAADYSGTYSDRSLIDKGYADATYMGNDSTFVKISGSYANKRITDNIYKTGTLSLRTTDTTGVLTIQQDETGSKPSLYLAGNQETLLRLQADSNGDSISHWGIYRQFFDNASSVGDNQVVSIGFNTFSGGGQDDPTKGMMRIGMEEKFTYGTYPAFELHVPEIRTKAGATRRPLTGLFGHDLSGGGVWTFQSDHIVFKDYKTAGNDVTWGFGTNGAYPKGIVFSDTASISFGKSLSGSAINFRNAANSAYVNALTLNSSNEVALGTTAAGINILPASIKLNSSPKLFTADGSGVAIGYSSFPNNLDVYGASQSLFRLRNSLETTGWYLRVGASAFDLYTPTNTAALVVAETAPNYTLSLKSDGDVGFGILTPLSRAHIYTASGATKSMIRLQNAAHAADVFTTNATPEGAITAPVGSIALSNISSAGGLWIKETGAGTTGWNNVATGLAANTAKSYYLTRTLPASGSTIHLGVLNHSGGGGGYCELHCVVNNGSGNAIAKKYLIPLAFSNTGGVWQNLLPIASTGAYIGNDFKIEMKNSSTRDTLRVRTVSGSTGGTLLVSLYMYPYQGSASTFVETTTAETPTAVTATFQKMPWSAEANLAGINTLNPLGALHVTGTGATSSTYALRVQNSSSTNQFCIRNDGRTGIGNVTAPANVLDVEGAAVIGATYSGSSTAATNGLLVEGSTSIGNTSPGAKLHVTGAGTTSSTYSGIFEKSDGTDVFVVRDDGLCAIGSTPVAGFPLYVAGASRVDGLGLFRGAGSATGSTTAAGVRLYNTTSTETYNIAAKDGGDMAIYDNGGTESWTVTAAGLIGMGDTSPEEKLDVNGNVKALHYIGQSTAPSIAAGGSTVVGSGVSATLSGTDAGFEVSLTTGSTGISATGVMFTVTFNAAYGSAPVVVYSASNANAGAYVLTGYTYSTATTTTVTLTNATTNLAAETLYKWSFVMMGK